MSPTTRRLTGAIALCELLLLAEPGGPIDLARSRLNSFQDPRDNLVLAVHGVLAAAALVGLLRLRSHLVNMWHHLLPMLVFVAWVEASVLWSLAPRHTVDRVITLGAVILLGAWASVALPASQQLRVLAVALAIRSMLSAVVAWFVDIPHAMTVLTRGSQGAHVQSNYFGAACALGVVTSAAMALQSRPSARESRTFAALALFQLYLLSTAKCATAWAAVLIGVAVLVGARWRRVASRRIGRGRADAVSVVAVVATTAIVIARRSYIFGELNRTTDLSGRTKLWGYATNAFSDRPVQGWGFNAMWQVPNAAADRIRVRWGGNVLHLHNSYLEILLGTGVIGLTLFGFIIASAIVAQVHDRDRSHASGRAAVLAVVLVSMMTESVLIEPPHIAWAILAALALPRTTISRN